MKPETTLTSARWIISDRDLPPTRAKATYRVKTRNGDVYEAIVGGHHRMVVEALKQGDIRAASPIRLSSIILRLRRKGIAIETIRHEIGDGEDKTRVGTYRLNCEVERVGSESEVAA